MKFSPDGTYVMLELVWVPKPVSRKFIWLPEDVPGVVTKIRNGTERTGMVPPTKIRNARSQKVRFGTCSLASMALIMACSLSITKGFRFANGWDVLYTLLEKFLVCVCKLSFMDQEHCRDDTY